VDHRRGLGPQSTMDRLPWEAAHSLALAHNPAARHHSSPRVYGEKEEGGGVLTGALIDDGAAWFGPATMNKGGGWSFSMESSGVDRRGQECSFYRGGGQEAGGSIGARRPVAVDFYAFG
jgi:hypothetical protein